MHEWINDFLRALWHDFFLLLRWKKQHVNKRKILPSNRKENFLLPRTALWFKMHGIEIFFGNFWFFKGSHPLKSAMGLQGPLGLNRDNPSSVGNSYTFFVFQCYNLERNLSFHYRSIIQYNLFCFIIEFIGLAFSDIQFFSTL